MTQDELTELLSYNPETGVFTRKKWRSSNAVAGAIAGTAHTKGYIAIWVNGRRHMAHRLAWLYMYGELPEKQIDHINRNKADNRIANLRLADNSENQQNVATTRNNKSGAVGVFWNRRHNRWFSNIVVNRKPIHLGSFTDFDEAVAARKQAEGRYHPFKRALKEGKP